jgi:UDP-N-acetylmuramate dehydrogenase
MAKRMHANLPEPPARLGLVRDEPMSRHTYMRIGGPAAFYASPPDLAAFERIAGWAAEAGLPLLIIGGGSNVLVSDDGVSAVVVSLRSAAGHIEFSEDGVDAGAAVMLPGLAREAATRGLSGLEFAIGIPGSIGGALQSNAGIGDGRDIGGIVRWVEVWRDGERLRLERDELTFSYRSSSLRGSGDIVLAAGLALAPAPPGQVETEMGRLLYERQQSQPTASPNAGSIFRNPENDFAGRLVEDAGCKGLRQGHAEVSRMHANFIVHDGQGTASDVAKLMETVQARVLEDAGVRLRPEIVWWGDGAPPAAFAAD